MSEYAFSFEGIAHQSYEPIQSDDELARLVEGMKQYARSTEFDYDRAKEEALTRSDMTTEEVGVNLCGEEGFMLRTRSSKSLNSLMPFTRFVALGYETLQICYTEFQTPPGSDNWMFQLQIINNCKVKLGEGAISIAKAFVDKERNITIVKGTPPHVLVLFQEIQR